MVRHYRAHSYHRSRFSVGSIVQSYLHLDQSSFYAKLQYGAVGAVLILAAYGTRQFEVPIATHITSVIAGLWLIIPVLSVAYDHLCKRRVSLHELAILAVLGAFASGHYLEAGGVAAIIITSTFIYTRIGRRSKAGLTSDAIVAPPAAIKMEGNKEKETESTDLAPGDVVRLRVGDHVPADGKVVSGYATLNERAVNGANVSIDKTSGDTVFAGSVNTYGSVDIQLTATGANTWVRNRAIQLARVYNTTSGISWFIRRYGAWYTPIILLIAAGVMIGTNYMEERWERAIGMLLVASPSALILAIAAACTSATSCASRVGVLLRRATDLDRARRATTVLLDETEGLAVGQYTVVKYGAVKGVSTEDLLKAASTALQHTSHPVADAITTKARQYQVYPEHAEGKLTDTFEGGCRVEAEGVRYSVGRSDWLGAYSDKKTRQTLGPIVDEVRKNKKLNIYDVIYVVIDGHVSGWVALGEKPRPDSPAAIARLKELGIERIELVTNHDPGMVQEMAKSLGIEMTCNASIDDLRSRIRKLRADGERVAVVRDATADSDTKPPGDIAFDLGSTRGETPSHAKRVSVYSSSLGRVPFLIHLSQQTHQLVRRCIWMFFGFVMLMLSVCAMGWISPVAAAAIHAVFGIGLMILSLRPLKLDKIAMSRERKVRMESMKQQYLVEKAA